eukprot:6212910-Amphidinium_carterae.1
MEAYAGQEDMLELCLMDYMEGIPVHGLRGVHVDDLGIGTRHEVLNALSDALHGLYKTEKPKILGLDGSNEIVYLGL